MTPHVLAAAYEYLRATSPFKAWKLPHADEVEFAVTERRDCEGDHGVYRYYTNEHIITISSYYIKTTPELMVVMAHEMIHERQEIAKTARRGGHNKEFHRLAKRVCKVHGWDSRLFI
ncbi:MAG: SprT-like domain-containing protein [Sulfuricaulis sp.]|nr:SprT-like domain-containing protein [Sulfuricaulis sp.]